MPLESKLEALLFYRGEPEKPARLAKLLDVSADEIDAALARLEQQLAGRGIRLLRGADGAVELRTAPELSGLIESIRKDELSRDLGRAGAETLAIICYRGPLSRAQIDHIRGVNSTFILRNLLIRGLIERYERSDKEGAVTRGYLYRASPELVAHLGLTKLDDLPEYHAVQDQLTQYEQRTREEGAADSASV